MLSVLIRWIGWDIELSRTDKTVTTSDDQKVQIKSFGTKTPADGKTEEFMFPNLETAVKFDRYGLTKDG